MFANPRISLLVRIFEDFDRNLGTRFVQYLHAKQRRMFAVFLGKRFQNPQSLLDISPVSVPADLARPPWSQPFWLPGAPCKSNSNFKPFCRDCSSAKSTKSAASTNGFGASIAQ